MVLSPTWVICIFPFWFIKTALSKEYWYLFHEFINVSNVLFLQQGFFKQKTHKGHDLILFTLWILMYRRSCMVHSNETRTYYLRSRLISCVNPVWIFRTLDSQKNLLHWTGQEYFFTVCVNPFSRDGGINPIMQSGG